MRNDDEKVTVELSKLDLKTAACAVIAKASRVRAEIIAAGASLKDAADREQLANVHRQVQRLETKASELDACAVRLLDAIEGEEVEISRAADRAAGAIVANIQNALAGLPTLDDERDAIFSAVIRRLQEGR
jgi:uncharacterized sporulation protein YeaH/YhbH (DUF444 family)